MLSFTSIILLLAAHGLAQFVKTPTDLITLQGAAGIPVRFKRIPNGFCETRKTVRSYSGYSDIGTNEHIHWFFFEARKVSPLIAPLTVWINGGPGSSSEIGLFQENGPCRIDSNGAVVDNPFSWSTYSNMLFIDQPVTVGFSYSDAVPGYTDGNTGEFVQLPSAVCPDYAQDFGTCGTYSSSNQSLVPNTTDAAAPYLWAALQGFLGAFPQYARDGFHFATESYGGHYGPIFNEYFEMQNKKNIKGARNINLETVSIGNGWFDPLIQYQSYYNFTVYPGNTYDVAPFTPSIQALMYNGLYGPGNCVDQTNWCTATGQNAICAAADNFCYAQVEYVLDVYANRDEYDIRELSPDPFPPSYFVDYLNSPKVQAAVGAYVNYSDYSPTVGSAFGATGDDDRELGTVEDVLKLLKQNVRVTMFFGDADYICNWIGGEVVANEVKAPGYNKAGYVNITTSDNIVHGQVKASGNFSFVRIYESGHEVPFYQPLVSLEMFRRIINGLDIETGKVAVTSSYRTVGTPTSTYRQGNGTVQYKVVPDSWVYNTTTNQPNPPTMARKRSVRSEKPRRIPRRKPSRRP